MYLREFFGESLREMPAAVTYEVGRRLAELFPDRVLLEGDDCDFTLDEFARSGGCRLRQVETGHAQVAMRWDYDRGAVEVPRTVWYEVDWAGERLEVILLTPADTCSTSYWILADSEGVARKFFAEVCAWDPDLRGEILVFDGGCWDRRPGLVRDIRGTTFETLVLPGTMKDDLRADLERFFASKTLYETYGLPWKRGVLLTGPPGNGKTHAVKALVNALGKPCLYVKSFKAERRTEHSNIRLIFRTARRLAPCLLVLEDLDSLVTDENRSFFLNELDGFAANAGIATVASTNHPEKLDPAIVERPSRFDRKYHFDLPALGERRAFLGRWAASVAGDFAPPDEGRARAAEATEGFSFAYLKELCLSAMLAKVGGPDAVAIDAALLEQVAALRSQMTRGRAS